MAEKTKAKLTIEELTDMLLNFSIDRSEIKLLLDYIPQDIKLNRTAVEYEIQILRILGVGWGIGYYLEDNIFKQTLSESFWKSIRNFSDKISPISAVSIDQEFNYFEVIRERLDVYLKEFKNKPTDIKNPASIIGPKFAELCGHSEDAMAILLGSKMFQSVLTQIKTSLADTQFIEPDQPFEKIHSEEN